jgi:hypothetical protein
MIFGLVTTYFVTTFYLVVVDSIERSGNHVKAVDWNVRHVLLLLQSVKHSETAVHFLF